MNNRNRFNASHLFIPLLLILFWICVGTFGGPTFGKLSSIATNDQGAFLPANSDSTKVQKLSAQFSTNTRIPAIVVAESPESLQPANFQKIAALTSAITSTNGIAHGPGSVLGPIASTDRRAIEYIVQINGKLEPTITNLRRVVHGQNSSNLTTYVTGPAGLAADLFSAFKGIDGILIYVALIAVFVILLLVYRSIVLPFIVLLTALFALSGAGLVVYNAVTGGVIKLNGQSQGILSILAIGAATDYSLLLIARYREALEHVASSWEAMKHALKTSFEPITASAATVIAGVLCLLFSELNSNKDLGPVAALGIGFSYLAAMTFLPAILLVLGRFAFWPFRPKLLHGSTERLASLQTGLEDRNGIWRRVPELIARYPRKVWLICFVVLVGFAFMTPQFKASGVSEADSILGASDAVAGQKVLNRHFSAGTGSPAVIIADASHIKAVSEAALTTTGINSVIPYTGDMVPDGNLRTRTPPQPTVIGNKVMLSATLDVAGDSTTAQGIITNLRSRVSQVDGSALVGGEPAIRLDTNNAAVRDLHTIIPIVLIVILLILMVLLRSLVAPILLIASVILSFTATIGVSALVFNHILHFAGSDAAIPLFGFIFLVALGVDYNIFLMTRVREESVKNSTRFGILRGLSLTGSVITSAGIVLAATFAALAVVPILFLLEIAFIVAFGVLLDTIIVRSLLIPALCYDLNSFIWWPSKLSQTKKK